MAWDKLLISADSHVVEPADLFASTLGDKHGDKVPRFVSEYQGVEGRYYFTGKEYLRLSVLLEGDDAEQDKLTKAGRDPGFRLQCLDEDGIYAEILYASSTLHTMRALDDQLVQDCCGVFSDWLADHRSEAPKRLFGCAPIHMADVNWAIAELERVAKLGMATATINCDTREAWEPYRSAHYDPFWARAEEIGMPLSLHILTGNERASFTLHGDERSQGVRRSLDVFHEAFPTLANEFIFGGIFDRFPKLNIMLAEFEVSWLVYWMFRVEQFERNFGPSVGSPMPKRRVRDYMGQVYHGVVDELYLDKVLDLIDPKTLVWGSDFPHNRCTYPNSQKIVDDLYGHHSEALVDDLTFNNAARLFCIEVPLTGSRVT